MTYSKLVERHHNQLVGQYMRDSRSLFGVSLLVYHGKKKYWKDMEAGKRFSLSKLVEWLGAESREIVRNRDDLDEIRIVGIDLTKRGIRPKVLPRVI